MTLAIEYIKTGLIITDLNEPEYFCPCCGGYALARDDMADDRLYGPENFAWLESLAAKHGGGVCQECADAHDKAELAAQD